MATPLHNPEIPGAKLKNWMKTGLGVLYTKEGIEPFVYDEIEQFQQKCLRDIRNINGLPADATCFSCCTENVVVCPTNRICNAGRGQCSFHRNSATQYLQSGCPKKICHNLKNEIQNAHRFYGPSYKTTDARQWCSNPWEVAKCFMPPDGYKDVTSAAETDFRGIISVIKNYKPFQPKVDDELSKRNNIFDKAIEVENAVRHSSHLGMEDEDVQQYLRILQDVLTYPGYLASNSTSQKLSQLENDTLLIDIEDIHKVLNNLAKAAENELKTEKDEDKRKAIKQKLEIIKVTNESICELGSHEKVSLSKMEEELQHAHDKVKEVGPSTKREVLQNHEDSDTVPSDMDLDRIARAIGINWELLGPHLGLTKTNIDHIKMDNDTSQKRIYQMLYIWREDQGPNGTKRNLFTAFRNQPSTSIDWETLDEETTGSTDPKMLDTFKTYIDKSHRNLTTYMVPDPILDIFLEDKLFNFQETRDIREEKYTTEKNRKILDKVRCKGKNCYDNLKKCLVKTNQELLFKLLECVERDEDTTILEEQLQGSELQVEDPAYTKRKKDKITEPEKSPEENPVYQHAVKTGKKPDCIDLKSWNYCLDQSDWTIAETLLSQGVLPDKKQLKTICIKLGRNSDLMQKICQQICDHIKKRRSGNPKIFPAIKSNKDTDITFVIIGKKEIETESFEYDVLYHTGSTEMKAISVKKKQLAKQRFLSETERNTVKQCINTLYLDLFKQHKYLSLVESSPYRSKGYIQDKHELIKETCIVLGVAVKGYFPIDEDELPSKIGTFNTDIREITITKSTGGSPFDFHENIKMNCVISGKSRNTNQCSTDYGTMGIFVSESCSRNKYCLGMTCAHVLLKGEELRSIRQERSMLEPKEMYCYQPIYDNKSSRRCGEVKYALFNEDVDVVLFSPDKTRCPRNGYFPGNYTLTFNGRLLDLDHCPVYETRVLKLPGGGVSDEITYGEIVDNISIIRDHSETDYDYILKNQIHIQSDRGLFSKNGDSGSCVFWKDETNRLHAVGMIVADNKMQDDADLGESFATPITAIRDAFDNQRIELRLHTFTSDVSQDYQQNSIKIENEKSVGNENISGTSAIDSGATGEALKEDASQDYQQKRTGIENAISIVNDSNSVTSAIDSGAIEEGRRKDLL